MNWKGLLSVVAVLFLVGVCSAQDAKGTVAPQSHHEHLKPLKYFIGDWELTGEVQLAGQPKLPFVFLRHFAWTLGGNFIETKMTQVVDGKSELRHKSMICWDPKAECITETGYWNSNLSTENPAWSETVTYAQDGNTWIIAREGVKGVFTIIDQNTHRYECHFRGDDGSENSWHFVAKRKKPASDAAGTTAGPDYKQLKGMEWMIGDWEAEWVVPSTGYPAPDGYAPGSKVKSTCSYSWIEQKNYIGLKFRDEIDGKVAHEGFEIIGVDPHSKKIIHWLSSILGGWGTGEWSVEGKTWKLKWSATTGDGTTYEGVSFMVPLDAKTHTWEMKDNKRNGQSTPDTPLVTYRRIKK